MVSVLNDKMTKDQLVQAVLYDYADPANWESYEKDMGYGAFDVAPWITRDKGRHAGRALELLAQHPARSKDERIADNVRDYIFDVTAGKITAEQAFFRIKGVVEHYDAPVDERGRS